MGEIAGTMIEKGTDATTAIATAETIEIGGTIEIEETTAIAETIEIGETTEIEEMTGTVIVTAAEVEVVAVVVVAAVETAPFTRTTISKSLSRDQEQRHLQGTRRTAIEPLCR